MDGKVILGLDDFGSSWTHWFLAIFVQFVSCSKGMNSLLPALHCISRTIYSSTENCLVLVLKETNKKQKSNKKNESHFIKYHNIQLYIMFLEQTSTIKKVDNL